MDKSTEHYEEQRIELWNKYVRDNIDIHMEGISSGAFTVIHDPNGFRFNCRCGICMCPTETGEYRIKENKNPVCPQCGEKFNSEEEE